MCAFAAPLREWVGIAHKLPSDLSSADRKKIFHDNAAAWYKV